MKIGIHNEPAGAGIGGTEYLVAMIAETLCELNDVEIIHHRRNVDLGVWSAFSGTSLTGVRLRYVEPERPQLGNPRRRSRIFQKSGQWQEELSRPYDLFITVTHGVPPLCHARAGVLIVLFPLSRRSEQWPWSEPIPSGSLHMRQRLRGWYYDWRWKKCFDSYQSKLAISEFSRKWTREYWGLDCRVLYPAVETRFAQRPKQNRIISVGRFSLTGPRKNHPLMLETFADLVDVRQQGWRYHSLGGMSDSATDQAYFESLQRMARGCDAEVTGNLERDRLVREYEEAKVFWHAAGYGENELEHPVAAEHFGIVTVEAMAAGCVPVVINKGGQPEIVQHGVNGFLWNTPEELTACTKRLVSDDQLRARMSAAARERAAFFGREQFAQRFQRVLPGVYRLARAPMGP
jgi:L-malate glycosyltransferase